jgi:nucleoside-diphosphate-sugar epimerase
MNIPPVTSRVSLRTAKAAGWLLERVYGILRLEQEPKMTRFLAEQLALSHWFSRESAESILGYSEQVTTDQGVERLVDWLQSQQC